MRSWLRPLIYGTRSSTQRAPCHLPRSKFTRRVTRHSVRHVTVVTDNVEPARPTRTCRNSCRTTQGEPSYCTSVRLPFRYFTDTRCFQSCYGYASIMRRARCYIEIRTFPPHVQFPLPFPPPPSASLQCKAIYR